MNNFNTSRFCQYAKWDLTLNQKFYRNLGLVYLFIMLGVVLVSFFIRWMMYSVDTPGELFSDISLTTIILNVLIYYAIVISAGCVFHPLRNKQGRITNLTLPATNLEKYIWHLLVCVVGTFVIGLIGLALCDVANALMTLGIFGSDYVLSILKGSFDLMYWPSTDLQNYPPAIQVMMADTGFFKLVNSAIAVSLSSNILKISIYTFGNSIKYKYNIPLTYITLQAISFVFAIIIISFGIWAGNNSEYVNEVAMHFRWVAENIDIIAYCLSLVLVIVAAVLYVISYRRYCKAELTNYINK